MISAAFPNLSGISRALLGETLFEEQYLIFLLLLEEDYQTAEILSVSDARNIDAISFKFDLNQDGDYLDPTEQISYRWNQSKRRIDRRSGKGSFQALLDDIQYFSWSRIRETPMCHQLITRDSFHTRDRSVLFCRSIIDN